MNPQILFMLCTTAFGVIGAFSVGPYMAILVYYAYAVLRPDSIWKWALPRFEYGWSYWLALVAIATSAIARFGFMYYPTYGPTRGSYPLRWTIVHLFMILFFVWMVLSYTYSINQDKSLETFKEYIKIFVLFMLASYAVTRVWHLWYLVSVVVLADVYIAYTMNSLYYFDNRMDLQRDGFGGLDNNGAGLMIAMGVPICYIMWEACKGWFRWVFLMGAPILAYAVTLTYSRGAMVSILACLPMMLLLSQRKKYVIGAYILGAAFILGTSGPQLRDRFFSVSQHDADESANARKTAWKIALKMASEKPFFGMGIRCSQTKTFEYGADFENMAIHNTYLQFAADSGWLAMFWYIAMLGSAILLSVIFWFRTRKWPKVESVIQARAIAAAVACSLTVFMVGSFFLSMETFEMPYILALAGGQLWAVYRSGGVEIAAVNDMQATILKSVPTNEFKVREAFKRAPKPRPNQQVTHKTSTDTPEPTGEKNWDVLLEPTAKKNE